MGFDAHVLKVLIASPSDTTRERDAIEKTLYGTESFPRAIQNQKNSSDSTTLKHKQPHGLSLNREADMTSRAAGDARRLRDRMGWRPCSVDRHQCGPNVFGGEGEQSGEEVAEDPGGLHL